MNANLSRAHLLFDQGRYPMAAEEAGRQLAQDPDDPLAHCLLSLCLSKMGKHEEAIREAQAAVHLAPDFPNGYAVLGSVLDDVGRLREAEAAAREALRLDPDEADHYALLASIRVQQRQWTDALEQAEQGLSVDPDHTGCANLKGIALVNLGRRAEAGAAIQTNLAKDPENAATHANQGWAMLHRGDHAAAMGHFKEALRLKPEMEWARQGVLEALRARNPVYGLMLRYFLWMSRFSGKMQLGIIVGAWVGYQGVNALEYRNPGLAPFLLPVMIAYVAFVYLGWTARPLFNLLLRLDPSGRLALTRDQVVASNWLGAALLVALASLAGALATGRASLWFLAVASVALTVPLSATFGRAKEGRLWMAIYTAALALIACLYAGAGFLHGPQQVHGLLTVFIYGLVGFLWIANLSGARREYR